MEVDGEKMDINEPNPPNVVSGTNTSEPTGTTVEFDETIKRSKKRCASTKRASWPKNEFSK